MVSKGQKTKKKKFYRTPGGETRVKFFKGKPSKKHCALCSRELAGTTNAKDEQKLSKSERRPSGMFGGVLCAKCRASVQEEAAKIYAGVKDINGVEVRLRRYVEVAIKRISSQENNIARAAEKGGM
jgi:ribosomal protein L34E